MNSINYEKGGSMLWEGKETDWNNWENEKRIAEMFEKVFPTYRNHYVSLEPERDGIRQMYGVEGTLLLCSDARLSHKTFDLHDGELFTKRGVGAKFTVGNPFFRQSLSRSLDKTVSAKLNHLIVTIYHFSSSCRDEGCAGFANDDEKARAYALKLRGKLQRDTQSHEGVFVITIGIDTHTGNAFFHGNDGQVLSISSVLNESKDYFLPKALEMYHGWPSKVRRYIAERLMMGNCRHQAMHVHEGKPEVSLKHFEFVWGPGYGYFPFPKHRVFIHNPFIMDLREWDAGLKVIKSNLGLGTSKSSRIQNGFIMAASSMYRDEKERHWAIDEAKYLHYKAKEYIKHVFPELHKVMSVMPIIVSRETMEVTLLEFR